MGIIPMDKINIFPYFGGNMNNKTLTEQNITSSFKVLGLNSCGYTEYDTTGEVKPFMLSLKQGEEIVPGGGTYHFQITKGSGQINGYKFDIAATGSGEYIEISGYWQDGGTIYLQMTPPETSNGMLKPLYNIGAKDSIISLNYTTSYKDLPAETRRWCLPIYRMEEWTYEGETELIPHYTCPTSAFPNILMENGSQYIIDVNIEGININRLESQYYTENIISMNNKTVSIGGENGGIDDLNVVSKSVVFDASQWQDGSKIELKSRGNNIMEGKYTKFQSYTGTLGEICSIEMNPGVESSSSSISITAANGKGILLHSPGGGDIKVIDAGTGGNSISLGSTLKLITDTNARIKRAYHDTGGKITASVKMDDTSLYNGRRCEYTIDVNQQNGANHVVHMIREIVLEKVVFAPKVKDSVGSAITWEANISADFKFLHSSVSGNKLMFDNIQTFVTVLNDDGTVAEGQDIWENKLGTNCSLTNSRINFNHGGVSGTRYENLQVYPTIIGTPINSGGKTTNPINLRVHISVDMIQQYSGS